MSQSVSLEERQDWPELPIDAWGDTCATLHMWMQVVGKAKLALMPMANHWWNVSFFVSARGLTTGAVPFEHGEFEIEFDFLRHVLKIETDRGESRELKLRAQTVADFYEEFRTALRALKIGARIWPVPVEVVEAIPFKEDTTHRSYDPRYAQRFWRTLVQSDRVLKAFRGRFLGKASPVHFFWGAIDLAATRFSGRKAPKHPGGFPNVADWVMHEAYSHECSSCGFWPGYAGMIDASFYAYAYPQPDGFAEFRVSPFEALFHPTLKEFVLPYDAVRKASDPDAMLLDFFQSTYEAAASLANWDRAALERGWEASRR